MRMQFNRISDRLDNMRNIRRLSERSFLQENVRPDYRTFYLYCSNDQMFDQIAFDIFEFLLYLIIYTGCHGIDDGD